MAEIGQLLDRGDTGVYGLGVGERSIRRQFPQRIEVRDQHVLIFGEMVGDVSIWFAVFRLQRWGPFLSRNIIEEHIAPLTRRRDIGNDGGKCLLRIISQFTELRHIVEIDAAGEKPEQNGQQCSRNHPSIH